MQNSRECSDEFIAESWFRTTLSKPQQQQYTHTYFSKIQCICKKKWDHLAAEVWSVIVEIDYCSKWQAGNIFN